MFNNIYKGKKVLVTGHTGFKGSWLCKWLEILGSDVLGFSLEPSTLPNHFDNANIKMESIIGNINDYSKLNNVINNFMPNIIFHLAAQPSVLQSYVDPITTFNTNVMGTANLLNICRSISSLKGVVVITTDKCYKNNEWVHPYRETDILGGIDPYSNSKACSELVVSCFRDSFFNKQNLLIASARAGNVIGGGDWVLDRLVPDAVKSAYGNRNILLRNPKSVRPWQHVLEPLSGYLLLGQQIFEDNNDISDAWNFGPLHNSNLSTKDLVDLMKKYWDNIKIEIDESPSDLHEANLLMLDSSKSYSKLNWEPVWDINTTIKHTINWYKSFYYKNEIITKKQIEIFVKNAFDKNLDWAK